MQTFKDENLPLQHLARELAALRRHNLRFKVGEPQDEMLMFAEAALTCLTLEHFLRVVLAEDAGDTDVLYNLLEKAVAKGLVRVPWDDPADGIRRLHRVRNTLLHANYAQAAREAGAESVGDYFRTQFAAEIEAMYRATDFIVAQIDPATGKRRP
jgi:hypothetical protein